MFPIGSGWENVRCCLIPERIPVSYTHLDVYKRQEESYILCVSSPGIDRPLKRPRDFEKHMGEAMDVKLYEKLNGSKEFVAVLSGYEQGRISLDIGEEKLLELEEAKVALIRPHIDF